jgi:hypothetical protein
MGSVQCAERHAAITPETLSYLMEEFIVDLSTCEENRESTICTQILDTYNSIHTSSVSIDFDIPENRVKLKKRCTGGDKNRRSLFEDWSTVKRIS